MLLKNFELTCSENAKLHIFLEMHVFDFGKGQTTKILKGL